MHLAGEGFCCLKHYLITVLGTVQRGFLFSYLWIWEYLKHILSLTYSGNHLSQGHVDDAHAADTGLKSDNSGMFVSDLAYNST